MKTIRKYIIHSTIFFLGLSIGLLANQWSNKFDFDDALARSLSGECVDIMRAQREIMDHHKHSIDRLESMIRSETNLWRFGILISLLSSLDSSLAIKVANEKIDGWAGNKSDLIDLVPEEIIGSIRKN